MVCSEEAMSDNCIILRRDYSDYSMGYGRLIALGFALYFFWWRKSYYNESIGITILAMSYNMLLYKWNA